MKNIKITKIIAFFMAVLMILPMVPVVDLTVFAEGEGDSYIGYTATFADFYEEFYLAPSADAVTGYDKTTWDNSVKYSVYDYIGDSSDLSDDEYNALMDEFYSMQMVVVDCYVSDEDHGALWFKVEAADGFVLPEILVVNPWIFAYYSKIAGDDANCTLFLFPAGENVIYDENGNIVSSITMDKYEKPELTALSTLGGDVSYQWQIEYAPDQWANIYGESGSSIKLSYGMLATLLEGGSVNVRCKSENSTAEAYSAPISVTVMESTSSTMSTRKVYAEGGGAEETTGADTTLYNVIINYVFEDGSIAANPYTAKVGATGGLDNTVTFPVIQGYKPTLNGEDVTEYQFNLQGGTMTEDFILNVIYRPTLVDYTIIVKHQNVNNDNYTEVASVTKQALTGTIFKADQELDISYPGFYQLMHNEVKIAASGNTVIELKFDRFYYLMTFNMGEGGYGDMPIYVRYGTEVNFGNPTRPGYKFEGWIDPDGNTVTSPYVMPVGGIELTAVYTAGKSDYTVIYWKENADPDADGTYGYTYWGSEIRNVTTGITVSGSDDIPTSITNVEVNGENVNEKKYFTYNDTFTDKNVVVKGDGSTVVNVYYTRNFYTLKFTGYGKCCLPEHDHTSDCERYLMCPVALHVHTEDCGARELKCTITEHTVHTSECLKCLITEHEHSGDCCNIKVHDHTDSCLNCQHIHSRNCYNFTGTATVSGTPTNTNNLSNFNKINTINGLDIYRSRRYGNNTYYVRIGDSYYQIYIEPNTTNFTYNIDACTHEHEDSCYNCGETAHTHGTGTCTCAVEEHIHAEGCYTDSLHSHSDSCFNYPNCEVVNNHTHTDDCYSQCTITEHSHGTNCNSDNTNNVIYVITAKYEANIGDIWPTYDKLAESGSYHYKNNNGEVVNGTTNSASKFRGWDIPGADAEAVSKRVNMTPDLCNTDDANREKTVTAQYGATYTYRLYYMFESFDQSDTSESDTRKKYNDKWYDYEPSYYQELQYSSQTNFGQKEILGMNPKGVESEDRYVEGVSIRYNWLYYDRNSSNIITYQSKTDIVDTKTGIKFGESLAAYEYSGTLPYPSTLEEGAYEFGGWYTTAGCYDGTKVDFENDTMPNGDVTFYAKWQPVLRKVDFYNQSGFAEEDKIGDTKEVAHGSIMDAGDIPDPTNGEYIFNGWYFIDDYGNEQRFDFANIPLNRDLKVYAKWTSNKLIQYKVHYVLDSDPTIKVADSIEGSSLAGETLTFDAKGANDLYTDFQTGYYPNIQSDSITLDINDEDGVVELTFKYTQADAVSYSVYYLAETLKEGTETFGEYTIDGKKYYMIAETKTEDDNRLAYVSENFVPVKYYMPDKYQKNLVIVPGNDNAIFFFYSVDEKNAFYKITHYIQNLDGETWTVYHTVQASDEIGKTITESELSIPGFTFDSTVEGTKTSGKLTDEGLELDLYYTRNKYPYIVQYRLRDGTLLHTISDLPYEFYGKVISNTAPNKFGNYELDDDATKTLNIRIESNPADIQVNIITFYYKEAEATINYVPVGGGKVDPEKEMVKVVSGNITGSVATANYGYKFIGWFDNASCSGTPISTNAYYIPEKQGELWEDATYYAKFEEIVVSVYYEAETGGKVSVTSETVGKATGTFDGSSASAYSGYTFIGWYCDGEIVSTVANFTPSIADAGKTFVAMFEENTAIINYAVVGPDGTVDYDGKADYGEVTLTTETVKIVNGIANGSTATVASDEYKFVGWYYDAACTDLVTNDYTIYPKQVYGLHVETTYYAKFEYNLTSLTIVKSGAETYANIDPNQTFIFNIKGDGVDLDVTVHGDTWSVTVDGLTVGAEYTITEKTEWSWRYNCTGWSHTNGGRGSTNEAKITLGLDGTITFTNNRALDKWLDGDSWLDNLFSFWSN